MTSENRSKIENQNVLFYYDSAYCPLMTPSLTNFQFSAFIHDIFGTFLIYNRFAA